MADKSALEAEKDKLIAEMADMQKQIMNGVFEEEFDAKKYYSSEEMKAFKDQYNEKAKRVSDIAIQLTRI